MIGTDLKRIRTLFGILDEYQLRVANPKEWADWRSPKWVCFYEVAFVADFIFSFPKLFREFFAHFGISLSQLLPNVWRTLLALLVLVKSLDMEFELADLLFSYFLKEHDLDKGWYTLYRRKGHDHLITELSTSDKAWKNNVFFISENLLENKEGEPQISFARQRACKKFHIFFELLFY